MRVLSVTKRSAGLWLEFWTPIYRSNKKDFHPLLSYLLDLFKKGFFPRAAEVVHFSCDTIGWSGHMVPSWKLYKEVSIADSLSNLKF